jgi:hypothetical protein
MLSALSNLKARMFRPPSLSEGSEFALGAPSGTPAEDDARWRVAAVRMLRGIPHALIEQAATGKTKTVAISALLGDPNFHALPGRS